MFKVFAFIVCLIAVTSQSKPHFEVNAELINAKGRGEILLQVKIVKVSGNRDTVVLTRMQDYKRKKAKALGNYVIEIQKSTIDGYILFEPSADIDPVFNGQKIVFMKKGGRLTDTIYIDRRAFSRQQKVTEGFPPSVYRLRVYFNPNMWRSQEENVSNWVGFKID